MVTSGKSFRPKDGGAAGGAPRAKSRNAARAFHGEKRSQETDASTIDPDARLMRKGRGNEAKLCYAGHVVIDKRGGLAVAATVTQATGTACNVGRIPNRNFLLY